MGLTAKAENKSSDSLSSNENWGMGFLLVFFPEENQTAIVSQNKLFSSSSSIRRNSSSLLLAKAQSTISICALLVFISLLLFTLSTFEPTVPAIRAHSTPARRFLAQEVLTLDKFNATVKENPRIRRNSFLHLSWFAKYWKQKPISGKSMKISATALQGMGNLYRRGTRAMNDLVVCHVLGETTIDEFRLFLRILHRSSLASKSDIVILFPSRSLSSRFNSTIQEESDAFLQLVRHYRELNSTSIRNGSGFDPTPFLVVGKKDKGVGEPVWGKKMKTSLIDSNQTESTRLSYGSVVSFEAADLDPENSLAGFSDQVPMNLRRWASYPMLLGRLRRNFKHAILVAVKNTFLFGDPLGRVRNKPPESVFVYRKPEQVSSKHKRNSEKTQSNSQSAILMGGFRGVRRLSDAMLAAIVRTLMQQRKKSSVSESELLSQLAGNEFLSNSIDFINSSEDVPEFNPIGGLSSESAPFSPAAEHSVVQLGSGNFEEFNTVIRKKICSSEVDSYVYSECSENPRRFIINTKNIKLYKPQ